jgi:hypothetical protein
MRRKRGMKAKERIAAIIGGGDSLSGLEDSSHILEEFPEVIGIN